MELRGGYFDIARELFQQVLEVDAGNAPLNNSVRKFEKLTGNVSGLGYLRHEAENIFGYAAEATRVIRGGD